MFGFIFDFDGVIADSEALANTVLAEAVNRLGLPTTLDDALTRYMGKRWQDMVAAIQDGIGRPVPDNFSDDLKMAILARFSTDLREFDGASAFIRRGPRRRDMGRDRRHRGGPQPGLRRQPTPMMR
jgi:beta-phosphoglucomutase-like phosphatase (HAD superfamily)